MVGFILPIHLPRRREKGGNTALIRAKPKENKISYH
jgi:hypothetical protein